MLNKTILTGIISAALFVMLSVVPHVNILTSPANAAASGCLPGVLKSRLSQIRKKFGKVQIISTHRPGARIAGTGKRSYHASCRAVDFHAPKGKYSAVVNWLKSQHKGGVGTYSCGMHHIHIDNGPYVRFHKCVNKYGQKIGKKRHYAKRKSKSKKHYAYNGKSKYKNNKYIKPKYALGANKYNSYTEHKPVYKKTYSIYY